MSTPAPSTTRALGASYAVTMRRGSPPLAATMSGAVMGRDPLGPAAISRDLRRPGHPRLPAARKVWAGPGPPTPAGPLPAHPGTGGCPAVAPAGRAPRWRHGGAPDRRPPPGAVVLGPPRARATVG